MAARTSQADPDDASDMSATPAERLEGWPNAADAGALDPGHREVQLIQRKISASVLFELLQVVATRDGLRNECVRHRPNMSRVPVARDENARSE